MKCYVTPFKRPALVLDAESAEHAAALWFATVAKRRGRWVPIITIHEAGPRYPGAEGSQSFTLAQCRMLHASLIAGRFFDEIR